MLFYIQCTQSKSSSAPPNHPSSVNRVHSMNPQRQNTFDINAKIINPTDIYPWRVRMCRFCLNNGRYSHFGMYGLARALCKRFDVCIPFQIAQPIYSRENSHQHEQTMYKQWVCAYCIHIAKCILGIMYSLTKYKRVAFLFISVLNSL